MADDSVSALTWRGNLDISQAISLHEELSNALDQSLPIELDANGVERVDTSIIQLLTAFFKEAQDKDIDVKWKSTSVSLEKTARALDLGSELCLGGDSSLAEES